MNLELTPLFQEIFAASNDDAQNLAADLLQRHHYAVQRGQSYVYGEGTIPILLVAHTDIIHRQAPTTLYHDPAKHVVWSPTGLGADDRAGVYAIALLLAQGYRPHILFPDEEETGGHGAREAADSLRPANVHCLLELDRMNHNDAVTYHCDNPDWNDWLTRRHFHLAWGSYTDISSLMAPWNLAGANLSVGYYRQHTCGEYLRLDQLAKTVSRVARILRNPPKQPFPYIPEDIYPQQSLALEDYDENYFRRLDWRTSRWH